MVLYPLLKGSHYFFECLFLSFCLIKFLYTFLKRRKDKEDIKVCLRNIFTQKRCYMSFKTNAESYHILGEALHKIRLGTPVLQIGSSFSLGDVYVEQCFFLLSCASAGIQGLIHAGQRTLSLSYYCQR